MPLRDPEAKRAYMQAYHAQNRDRLLARKREKRQNDPEKAKALDRAAYLRKDKDKKRAANRRDYAKRKTIIAAQKQVYHQIYYPEHREERLAYSRAYKEAHREETRAYSSAYQKEHRAEKNAYQRQQYAENPAPWRAYQQVRRARKHQATINDLTLVQWQEIKEAYGFRCVYCGRKMQRLTQDHLTPLSKGGNHTASNVVPACKSCNSRKNVGPPLKAVQPLLLTVATPGKKKA